MAAKLALFQTFPQLEERLARLPLCALPTPVEPAATLESAAGIGPLFVKRDDQSARPYGGNKARKLEWLLGRALARGRSRVLTLGALGTNHGLATALYAASAGLSCDLVLVDQPPDDRVRTRLLQFAAVGARLHYGRAPLGAALCTLGLLARRPRTELILMGGSSSTGALGFVEAGLELAAQVRAGELPEPSRIYLPLGTGGSVAGLALGLALAGLGSRVVGVVVTDRGTLAPGRRWVELLARGCARLLRRAGAVLDPEAPELRIELETGFRGAGYGAPTEEGLAAVERARDAAGLRLETTYTGKALAALLAREKGGREPVLFWNTYAAADPELELPPPSALPHAFQRFFEATG